MTDLLHVAILGDVHGHLTLAYRVLRRWEQESGETLDAILQVGDLGAYPPPFRLDKATRRFAEHDPDELGFAEYYEGGPEASEVLGPDASPERGIAAPTVFIKGNHEDFEFLAAQAGAGDAAVPVDASGQILYLPSGARYRVARGRHELVVAGLGGISNDGQPGTDAASMFYTRSEVRRLFAADRRVDVFLSHEPPLGASAGIHPRYEGAGSPDVLRFIRERAPRFHFSGHYHEPGQTLPVAGPTQSVLLNAVNFLRPSRLNPGCIGILRWNGTEPEDFALLDPPWLRQYTRNNFRLF